MKPPKWYRGDEIYDWFNRRGPFTISKANAKWMAGEMQKAFEKGWEKRAAQQNHAPDTNPPPPVSREQARAAIFKKAFTEWDRRYREEPERFVSEAQRLLKEPPETYGDEAAPYFMALLDEIAAGKIT